MAPCHRYVVLTGSSCDAVAVAWSFAATAQSQALSGDGTDYGSTDEEA